MKMLSLGASLLVLWSAVGCCSAHRCGGAPDLCGNDLAGTKCRLKKQHNHRTHGCACGDSPLAMADCSCSSPAPIAGMPGCSAPLGCGAPAGCGAPLSAPGGDCGCGQPHAVTPHLAPAAPVNRYEAPPVPVPSIPPATPPKAVPSVPGTDVPMPPAAAQKLPSDTNRPQMVSVEEFQRLPGQVISTSASPTAQSISPPPVAVSPQGSVPLPQPLNAPEAAASPIVVQPANWMPARSN